MALFSIIDALFIGTHYLAWGVSVLGIPASLVLIIANITSGIGAMGASFAFLLLAAGLSVLIMPKPISNKVSPKVPVLKRLMPVALALCARAIIIAGAVYYLGGGLPELNLPFL